MIISPRGLTSTSLNVLREVKAYPADRPIYILADRDFPVGHPIHEELTDAAGCESLWLDLVAKDWLERNGQWNGRGYCIAVKEIPFGDRTSTSHQLHSLAIVLHEVAHVWQSYGREPKSIPAADNPIRLALTDPNRDPGIDDCVMRITHDIEWLRFAITLQHRCESIGMPLEMSRVLGYESSGWPGERLLKDSIKEELDLNIDFEELKSKPVPYRLIELWNEWCSSSRKESA